MTTLRLPRRGEEVEIAKQTSPRIVATIDEVLDTELISEHMYVCHVMMCIGDERYDAWVHTTSRTSNPDDWKWFLFDQTAPRMAPPRPEPPVPPKRRGSGRDFA